MTQNFFLGIFFDRVAFTSFFIMYVEFTSKSTEIRGTNNYCTIQELT